MCHLSSRHSHIFFLSALIVLLAFGERGNCQSKLNRWSGTPASSVQLQATKDDLTLTVPLAQPIERPIRANVRLVLVSPEDIVRAQLSQDVQLLRHQKQLVVKLPKPFEKVPAQDMEMLHWLRVKYEVTSNGEILASGIEPLRAATTDPFVLTAAASRVASPGLPYRVQVHVKSNIGQPLAGVQVNGNLAWDEDESGDKDKKIVATGVTSTSGNATLEFLIPREVQAEEGDLTVSVKSGLVARSVERSVDFRARSYLLLDTDKDIYQPSQILHARTLRFNSERKAVEKETLDLRIEDEERTLVFKQTISTDSFGVAHIDWQIPANLRQGSYLIRVGLVGQDDNWRGIHAEKSVRIYRYDLPNFRVSEHPDKTYYLPGQNADIAVSADYLFGKPVTRGKVRIVEESDRHWNYRKQQWDAEEGQVKVGELDRDGHFTAHFDLGKSHDDLKDDDYRQFRDVDLAAYVTDLTTGRTEQRRFELRVTKKPIHVYISPTPSRSLKMPDTFFVSTFYADGTPARCKVQLSVSNDDEDEPRKLALRAVQTNKYGLAKVSELPIPKLSDSDSLVAEAHDAKGRAGSGTERIWGDYDDLGVVRVTTSHAIHKAGDPIEVTLRSTRQNLRLEVQAIREGVVLANQQTKLRNGHGFVTFPYDPRFTDEVGIFAFSLEEEWGPTVILEGERTVLYPKNRQLDVGIHLDKDEHKPGEPAAARFTVRSADKTTAESALGIKIVDRAVEERARTDSDFGQQRGWGWWRWSLWSSSDSSFAGITRDDLDHIDLSEPVSPEFDLVAEFILQSSDQDALEMLEDKSPVGPEEVFSKILGEQFEPLDTGLRNWNQQGKSVRNVDDLEAVGKEGGVDVKGLRDPWGTPYRYAITFQGTDQILSVTSAGPDKHFGTADDFQAHRAHEQYFLHYGKLVESASHELMSKEGRFIRNRGTLQTELSKRGIDFNELTDPWGLPYETRFSVSGSYYVTEIVSHGEHPESKRENTGTVVWTDRVDYFVKSRENINKVLTAHLNSGGTYPTTEAEFKEILRKAGVDLDELRDPWGHAYCVAFQKLAQYSDRVKIQQTNSSGGRVGEPVTLIRQDVRVLSAGPDGKPDTPDDFQVASYSILVSEQSAKDAGPQPAPAGMSLATDTGAITGIIVDPMGAVISNATVEATLVDTEEKHTANTDGMGRFELKDLRPGVYDIKAYARGFRALEVTAVLVQATNVTQISFELSVGAATETVEVSAGAVAVETTMSSVSEVRSLPNLVTMGPGALNIVTKSGAMSTPRLRQDFPETMLWEPALITDRRGHARLDFKLADNITTWKLTAVGSTKNGELGRAEKDLRAFQPFFVEHDPPRILTQGDEISYPLVLRNYLDKPQLLKASMKPEEWFSLLGPAEVPVHVEAGDAAHVLFRYRAVSSVTDGKQQVSAANSEVSDAAQKPVDVHPFGRPLSVTAADVIDQNGALTARIPENVIPGSLHARVKIYPNLLAHVVENLEAGLEKPNGCGEQTISSTYPSLLVAELYAKSDPKPAIALKAQRYLVAGYERLLRYQAESGGFSYWGHGEAADIALTGYALEFLDHATTLTSVDDGVVQAAEQWLLQQQGPDGAWRGHWDKNDKDALLLTAYIAETLADIKRKEASKPDARRTSLERALAFLAAHRDLMDEPYIAASYALAAKAMENEKAHSDLLDWLRKNAHEQNGGAYWMLERNTPFYGWGRTGQLESTALSLRALVSDTNHSEADQALIRKGLLFLLRNEDKDGMWYCGQTTVHVLKTLLAMVSSGSNETGGKLSVRVNGKGATVLELPPTQTVVAPLETDISALMVAGDNRIELDSTTQGMMSVQLVADSYIAWGSDVEVIPKSEPNATSALRFSVEYSITKLTTGDNVECRIRAERLGYRGYGMMLGEVGLPPGAEVDRESLEHALQGNYSVYRYDVEPDRVILYMWPEAGGSVFSFRFRPRFGMSAETAPSVLYDYYNPESSVTLRPRHFDVTQSQEN